eukprot:TRINITY_DN68944_c0_g1_i1.p1 TRINITY_DN68944_c0_g1~~TRINITY_DN68944_c0_g1_i1.p1  ORF type:complete len:425 (-),score=47.20 TRINITY_DN68944_c0_g1_i1:163-1437(-)
MSDMDWQSQAPLIVAGAVVATGLITFGVVKVKGFLDAQLPACKGLPFWRKLKAGLFAKSMIDRMDASAAFFATGLASKIDLWQTIYEEFGEKPFKLAQLAEKGGYDPRWLRELVNTLTCAGIIKLAAHQPQKDFMDDDNTLYYLPIERAMLLKKNEVPPPLPYFCELWGDWSGATWRLIPPRIKGEHQGKGIPYSAYEGFHDALTQASGCQFKHKLLRKFIYKNHKDLVPALQKGTIKVVEVGSSQGVALRLLAQEFPNTKFFGFDLDTDATKVASDEANKASLKNVTYQVADFTRSDQHGVPQGSAGWLIMFDVLHDMGDPKGALEGIFNLLQPGGFITVYEPKGRSSVRGNVGNDMATAIHCISLMHCMPVGLGADGKGAGMGNMFGRDAITQLMRDTGFVDVKVLPGLDRMQNEYFARKPE